MGRKKKGVTVASLDYTNKIMENLSIQDVDRLELRNMLSKAYRDGYKYQRLSRKDVLTEGIWVAITYFASHRESHQLLVEVIRALGLKYDECKELMDVISYNREIIEPYVDELFCVE